jgi:hypothetical protein
VYEAIIDSGAEIEFGIDVDTDGEGNVFALSYSYDALGTLGDLMVVKLSPAGDVLFTTQIAASDVDVPRGIAVDGAGDAYVVGRTLSPDFPVVDAMQGSLSGQSDGFLVKLSGEDGSIVFSTFLGGTRGDALSDVAVGPDGQLVLSGFTDSLDFPVVNAVQDELTLTDCFCEDAVALRITPDGQSITFSTYLGGRFTDFAHDVGVDEFGRIYIAGNTDSDDFPVLNAVRPVFGGDEDGFVARMDPDAGVLEYATYLGGSDMDQNLALAVSEDGHAYLTGWTQSPSFPTTPGAFQESFAGGILACGQPPFVPLHNCEDVYVTALDPTGDFLFSTFLGGGLPDSAGAIDVTPDGRVRVAGSTVSPDFPGDFVVGPQTRVFVSELSADGSALGFTTVIETNSPGTGYGLAIGPDGDTHFAGAINLPRDVYVVGLDTAEGCAADFNGDGSLDVLDFVTFQEAWQAQDPAADCDGSGTFDVLDFVCFQQVFVAGCS